jgi:hypothetical protein
MAGSSLLSNLARAAKLLALLFLFLLPFVSVSCSPQAMLAASRASASGGAAAPDVGSLPGGGRDCALLTATGLQLVTGNWQPSRECVQGLGGGDMPQENRPDANSPFGQPDYFVIGAAVLILLSLLASFLLKGGAGPMAAAGGCVLALCLLIYDIMMRWPGLLRAEAGRSPGMGGGGGGGGPSAEQMAQIVHIKAQMGFWLTVLALLAAVVLSILAMRKPSAAVPPPAI